MLDNLVWIILPSVVEELLLAYRLEETINSRILNSKYSLPLAL